MGKKTVKFNKSGIDDLPNEKPVVYKIFTKIVSSQLDSDRMDYLLRDSLMSGVQFGNVDIDRIIQNVAIVKNKQNVYHLAFHERALGNIEEMLDARFKMYRYFYNHHTYPPIIHSGFTHISKYINTITKQTIGRFSL